MNHPPLFRSPHESRPPDGISRQRILFLTPFPDPAGGISAVAAWIVEALKDEYEVTVLTSRSVNWDPINGRYGTAIRPEEVSVVIPNTALRASLRLLPDRYKFYGLGVIMRMARRIRDRYNLLISAASGEADLGGPGLLYVHYPYLAHVWKKYEDCCERPCLSQLAALMRGKVRPFTAISGFSLRRMKQNHVLVNSDWTGEIFRKAYGMPTQTFYPPVTVSNERLPWNEREKAFVTVGRLEGSKRFEWIADVIARVRQRHTDVKLHIVGTLEKGSRGREYYNNLCRLAKDNSEWLRLHPDLSREDLLRLLGRVQYGIHAKEDEHFGIAPAETLAAGCITFVHDSGGQVEIVARNPNLCFSTGQDAAAKIDRVLTDHDLRKSLLEFVATRGEMFSTERFTRNFRELAASSIRANAMRDIRANGGCSVALDPRSLPETQNSAISTSVN